MVPFLQPNLTKKLQKLFNYPPLCTSQQQLSVKEADVAPTKPSSASDDLTAAPSQEKPKLHSPRSAYTHGNPSGLSLYTDVLADVPGMELRWRNLSTNPFSGHQGRKPCFQFSPQAARRSDC